MSPQRAREPRISAREGQDTRRAVSEAQGDGWVVVTLLATLFVLLGLLAWVHHRDPLNPSPVNQYGAPVVPVTVPTITTTVPEPAVVPVPPARETFQPNFNNAQEEGRYYQVGVEITPGLWKTEGPAVAGETCYWERAKDNTGHPDAILANDRVTRPASVNIRERDKYFRTAGCKPWRLEE